MKDRLELSIQNDHEMVPSAIRELEEFCRKNKIPDKTCIKLSIVFDEVLTNIISYAYEDEKKHIIEIIIEKTNDTMAATFADDGMYFNPEEKMPPALDKPLENRKVGGLGIHIVRNLMDSTIYKRENGKNYFIVITNL